MLLLCERLPTLRSMDKMRSDYILIHITDRKILRVELRRRSAHAFAT
jgi:hypothetical protein